jgi:hypothetical protein
MSTDAFPPGSMAGGGSRKAMAKLVVDLSRRILERDPVRLEA